MSSFTASIPNAYIATFQMQDGNVLMAAFDTPFLAVRWMNSRIHQHYSSINPSGMVHYSAGLDEGNSNDIFYSIEDESRNIHQVGAITDILPFYKELQEIGLYNNG